MNKPIFEKFNEYIIKHSDRRFEVKRIGQYDWGESGEWIPEYESISDDGLISYTDDFEKGDMFLEGSIRGCDECSNWFFSPACAHFCSKKEAMEIGDLFKRLYEIHENNYRFRGEE